MDEINTDIATTMKKVPMRDFDKMKTRDFSVHPHIIANSKSLCGYDE